MKISVITVCFNSQATIERSIQSVVDQQWPEVEHIVIDGGSTDGTLAILERFTQHLAVLVSEPDKGIYDAMNKGLARFTGDVVCFLNADDQYADTTVFAEVVHQMRMYHLDALVTDVGFFEPDDPTRMTRRYRSGRFSPQRLSWGWMPAHPGLFLSSDVIRRVGAFKTDYRIAGDYEYIIRAFHGHQLNYKHLPRVMVKMQAGGISNSSWRNRLLLNMEVVRACKENGINTNLMKILLKYPLKLLELIV